MRMGVGQYSPFCFFVQEKICTLQKNYGLENEAGRRSADDHNVIVGAVPRAVPAYIFRPDR